MRNIYTAIFAFFLLSGVHAQSTSENNDPRNNKKTPDFSNRLLPNYNHEINVVQIGNNNSGSINGQELNLRQKGQQQEFYYWETSILPSDLKVNMKGTNNYVEIMGNNQIMDQAKINIKGSYKNIIIRNYP